MQTFADRLDCTKGNRHEQAQDHAQGHRRRDRRAYLDRVQGARPEDPPPDHREIAERIVAAARERGYRPNAIASSLRTRRSMTVGVVVPDITNAVFPPILRGIEDTLTPQGYIAMIANSDSDPKRESMLIDTLRARGVDGLILASAQREDPAISRAVEEGIPVVTVNRRVDDPNVSSVTNDEASGIGARGTPHDRARASADRPHCRSARPVHRADAP